MPAAAHFPRASAWNQMTGKLAFSCNSGPIGLWPPSSLPRNREFGVRWVGPPQSAVLQVEIPCPARDLPHRGRASLRQPETPTCAPYSPGGGRELPRRTAHLAESHQAAFLPVVRRQPRLRGVCVCFLSASYCATTCIASSRVGNEDKRGDS